MKTERQINAYIERLTEEIRSIQAAVLRESSSNEAVATLTLRLHGLESKVEALFWLFRD